MRWTRLVIGALVLAGCGDDKGRDDDTNVVTSATVPNPTTLDGSSGSEGAPTEGAEGSTNAGTDGVSASSTLEPTTAGPATLSGDTSTSLATSTGPDDSGPATSASSDTGETTMMVDPPKFDVPPFPDVPAPVCLKCELTIASQQSGTFAIQGQSVFATAQLQGQVVYALGTYGSGRFIASADSSLPFNEVSDCPISEWLAGNGGGQAKIMYFGWGPSDGPKQWNVPSDGFGFHLPAQYIGNPALLRQDYDIVLYLEGSGQFGQEQPSDQEMATVLDYVSMGGGAYISSEFFGYLNNMDLASVNRLLTPLGITSQPVSLNWGNVDGNIDFDCFPEPQ